MNYTYGVFLLRDDADAALEHFERELRHSPNHVPARLQIAFERIKRTEFAEARPYAEQAVKLAPDSPETCFSLARAYARAGRKEDAERMRAEFNRLDKMRREIREGHRSVPAAKAPPG